MLLRRGSQGYLDGQFSEGVEEGLVNLNRFLNDT